MGEAGFLSIRFVAFRYSSVHLEGQSRPDVGLKEPMTATNSTNTFIVGCVGPRFTTMHCLSVERDGANLLFVVWQGSVPNHRISSHLFLTILHNYQFRTNFAQFVQGFLRISQEVKYIFCSACTSFQLPEIFKKLRTNGAKLSEIGAKLCTQYFKDFKSFQEVLTRSLSDWSKYDLSIISWRN